MKIKAVSFSDFKCVIEVYEKEKMDLFVFLLVKVIEKGSVKTFKEVLLDLDITDALLYLFQNNFYYLLDNNLIVSKSDSEDISEIVVNDVSLSDFGKLCLNSGYVPKYKESISKRIIYNPYKEEFVSDNVVVEDSNVVVYSYELDFLKLINKYKNELVNVSDDFVLNYRELEASPYYFEVKKIDDKSRECLENNKVIVNDDKVINDDKKEFLSSNFKCKLFYGVESKLVNSDYYLLVSEDEKFKVQGNKVYIEDIVSDFRNFSFVDLGELESIGYNVCRDEVGSCIERIKLKNYKGDIKKYLLRNKDKYKDSRVIDEIIDLL